MKNKMITCLSVILLLSMMLCGCSNSNSSEKTKSTPIDDKYIVTTNFVFDYAQVIKFSDGDIVQIVGTDPFSRKSTKYYGIYELDGHKLKISIGATDIICVYLEDKNSIYINGQIEELSSGNVADKETMNMFD